jgi:hypothetical protein
MNIQSSTAIAFHPFANVFQLMEGAEFDELCNDIKANGLIDPITIYENMILDGRNRYRACLKIGVEPKSQPLPDRLDPFGFIVSKNRHRRHLTLSQKAMAAAEIATLRNGRPPKTCSAEQLSIEASQVKAARLMGASYGQTRRGRLLLTHGTPEEIVAVKSGAVPLRTIFDGIRREQQHKPRTNKEQRRSQILEDMQADSQSSDRKSGGMRLVIKAGKTVSEWMRVGIAFEKAGGTVTAAATHIGIDVRSYRCARDIIQLSDRTDLNAADGEKVKEALRLLDEERRLAAAYQIIAAVIDRVYGKNRRGFKNKEAAAKHRLERFKHAIEVIYQACESGSRIEIPMLQESEIKDAITTITVSRDALAHLMTEIKKVRA